MSQIPFSPKQHKELFGYIPDSIIATTDSRETAGNAIPLAARVRYVLSHCHCGKKVTIEGVKVQRNNTYDGYYFFVNGDSTRHNLESAVAAVVAAAKAEVAK